MGAEDRLSREYRIGRQWRVRFSLELAPSGDVAGIRADWTPHFPPTLPRRQIRQYREARSEFMGLVAAATGGPAVVIEP